MFSEHGEWLVEHGEWLVEHGEWLVISYALFSAGAAVKEHKTLIMQMAWLVEIEHPFPWHKITQHSTQASQFFYTS
jgi:hypothetical protein